MFQGSERTCLKASLKAAEGRMMTEVISPFYTGVA
jgi:hypothetical protein